jgi:hypothetical protein
LRKKAGLLFAFPLKEPEKAVYSLAYEYPEAEIEAIVSRSFRVFIIQSSQKLNKKAGW